MGYCKNITIDTFPKQGIQLGAVVDVCFRYDTTKLIRGVVVRDDMEHPWETMIRLDDDRYVLASECQYTIVAPQPMAIPANQTQQPSRSKRLLAAGFKPRPRLPSDE